MGCHKTLPARRRGEAAPAFDVVEDAEFMAKRSAELDRARSGPGDVHLRRWLWVVLGVALLLRVGWAASRPVGDGTVGLLPDQREYLSLGRQLLADGSLRFVDPRFGQTVWAYRTPGYPAFVALCGGSVRGVRVAQAVLDTATVAAVWLIACRWFGRASAVPVVAAAVVAADPFYVYFCGLILSETAFTALLVWGVYALVAGRRWTAGGLLVAAAYVRPVGILVGPLVAVAAGWANSQGATTYRLRRATANGAVVGVCLAVGLLPWAWRNHLRVGRWVWTSTNDGVTLYDGFHAGATGASDQRFLNAMPGLRPMTEVDRSAALATAARRWAIEHPGELPALAARKVARGWSPVPLSAEFGRPAYRWVSGAYAVPFDVLCLIGLGSRRLTRSAKLLLVMPAVAVTVAQVMSVGSIRYRLPAEATLAVLAAVGGTHRRSPVSGLGSRGDEV